MFLCVSATFAGDNNIVIVFDIPTYPAKTYLPNTFYC